MIFIIQKDAFYSKSSIYTHSVVDLFHETRYNELIENSVILTFLSEIRKMIEKNNIMLLNDIIYKIHVVEPFDEMRKAVLEFLQYLIPSAISTFYLASPANPYDLARPIGLGLDDERWQVYLDEFQALDYTRWTFAGPTAKAYRETDLLRDEVRVNTPYYKAMFEPSDVHYSAIVTIIHDGAFLGVINLFRPKEDGDFTDEEIFYLDMLKEHLGFRLYQSLQKLEKRENSYPTKQELSERYGITAREAEIIYLLLDGLSKSQMCEQLCISPNTLKKHTLNIYKKLEIKSWRELFQLLK